MDVVFEVLIAALIVIGGIFGLTGSIALVKLKDTMQRLHGPTKATTLGVGSILIASMIYFSLKTGSLSFHELLITLFLFLTAPITANFIAKAYMVKNIEADDVPEAAGDHGWAPYDAPPGAAKDS